MLLRVERFQDLTVDEFYRILKLRVDTFVVEQVCPYPELDDRDQEALHVWLEAEGTVQAYLRVMDRGVENEEVSIGRVIAAKRRMGLGRQVLQAGLAVARSSFEATGIYLEAQCEVQHFYEKQGFKTISEPFILDGIPHVKMRLD